MVETGDPPLIPESVLKRRHDLDDLERKRQAQNELYPRKNSKKTKKGFYVIKPEVFLAKARNKRNNEKRFLRVSKKGMQKRAKNKQVLATKVVEEKEVQYKANSVESKMVFVIRIRNNHAVPRQVKTILSQMRLKNVNEGVFVKYTTETRRRLHLVEPWVVYGPPSASSVKDLLERRGYARVNNERVPLSNNMVIENALGEKHNMLCVEDLVCSLTEAEDETFAVASNFLFPFQLSDSKTKFERKVLKMTDGKCYGDRGEEIEEYIQQVL